MHIAFFRASGTILVEVVAYQKSYLYMIEAKCNLPEIQEYFCEKKIADNIKYAYGLIHGPQWLRGHSERTNSTDTIHLHV